METLGVNNKKDFDRLIDSISKGFKLVKQFADLESKDQDRLIEGLGSMMKSIIDVMKRTKKSQVYPNHIPRDLEITEYDFKKAFNTEGVDYYKLSYPMTIGQVKRLIELTKQPNGKGDAS